MQDLYVDPSMTQNYLTGTLLDPVISAKGGIPKGANILMIGDPGTGKTTVAFNMGADVQIRYPATFGSMISAIMLLRTNSSLISNSSQAKKDSSN